MHNKKRLYVKNYILILGIVVFVVLGTISLLKFLDNKEPINLYYSESSKADYRVYLKENDFFDKPYLESNTSYISSLIDYISIDFMFSKAYDKAVSGNYAYEIDAILTANKSDGEKNYWTKEYKILEKNDNQLNKMNVISLNENIKIDYQTYNDLFNDFKKNAGISMDGMLKVVLKVKGDLNVVDYSESIELDQNVLVEIPLTNSSIDININGTNESNEKNILLGYVERNDKMHFVALVGFGISVSCILGLLYLLIRNIVYRNMRKSMYRKTLDKILSTYDSIIVVVDNIQNLDDYNIIEVGSFDELLDAHSEVRMPINFIENKYREDCLFVLINDKIAWIYHLKESDLDD